MGELGVLLLVVALVAVMLLLRWNMIVASRRTAQEARRRRGDGTGTDHQPGLPPVAVVATLLVLAAAGLAVAAYRLVT
jgi:hypothetical protein